MFLAVLLSVGDINALVPIIVIIILIAAAAGATRGFSFFNVFGISSLLSGTGSIGGASRGTASKSGYTLRIYLDPGGAMGSRGMRHKSGRGRGDKDSKRKAAIQGKMKEAAAVRAGIGGAAVAAGSLSTKTAAKANVINPRAGWATKFATVAKNKVTGWVKSGAIIKAVSPITYGVGKAVIDNAKSYNPKTEKAEGGGEKPYQDRLQVEKRTLNALSKRDAVIGAYELERTRLKDDLKQVREERQSKAVFGSVPVVGAITRTIAGNVRYSDSEKLRLKENQLQQQILDNSAKMKLMSSRFMQKRIQSRLEEVQKGIDKVGVLKARLQNGEITVREFDREYSRIYDKLYGPADKSLVHQLTNPYYSGFLASQWKTGGQKSFFEQQEGVRKFYEERGGGGAGGRGGGGGRGGNGGGPGHPPPIANIIKGEKAPIAKEAEEANKTKGYRFNKGNNGGELGRGGPGSPKPPRPHGPETGQQANTTRQREREERPKGKTGETTPPSERRGMSDYIRKLNELSQNKGQGQARPSRTRQAGGTETTAFRNNETPEAQRTGSSSRAAPPQRKETTEQARRTNEPFGNKEQTRPSGVKPTERSGGQANYSQPAGGAAEAQRTGSPAGATSSDVRRETTGYARKVNELFHGKGATRRQENPETKPSSRIESENTGAKAQGAIKQKENKMANRELKPKDLSEQEEAKKLQLAKAEEKRKEAERKRLKELEEENGEK